MKHANDEEMTSSASLYSISLSASLPSLTSSSSGLSGSSSSSYAGGLLSLSTTLSSIQDLQAIQDPEPYEQWPMQDRDPPLLPLAYAAPRAPAAPVLMRLKRLFARRTRLLSSVGHRSAWDLLVAAVFCFYLWLLLCALAGHHRGARSDALARCLPTSLASDPEMDLGGTPATPS